MCITCFAPILKMVQAEASIAMHPSNPRNVLVTANTWLDGSFTNSVTLGAAPAVSLDEGVTWTVQETGTGGANQGDPNAGIDSGGRRFDAHLAVLGVQAARSDDGVTWTPVLVDAEMGDRPHLWVDWNGGDEVYVAAPGLALDGITGTGAVIRAARSIDRGERYISQQRISTAGGGGQEAGVDLCAGPGPSGRTVYATWVAQSLGTRPEASAIEFNRSSNRGSTWLPTEVQIDSVGVTGQTRQALHVRGHNQVPRLSDSAKYPTTRNLFMVPSICAAEDTGDLWIIWTNKGDPLQSAPSIQDLDIYVIKSTNRGATWALPVKVNQDPLATPLSDQWFPRIAWDAGTGRLVAAFYDSRNHDYSGPSGHADHGSDVFLAVSDDGGATWEDVQVSDGVYTPTFPDVGNDYIGLAADHGRAHVAWADNRTGSGAASLKVYASRVLLWGPLNSSLSGSYSNVPGGTIDITITWQTNMAAAVGDRVFLTSPSGQQYTSTVCTTCTSNGTSHSLTMSGISCELGNWQFSVESAESFGTSRQSTTKTFKVTYCLY